MKSKIVNQLALMLFAPFFIYSLSANAADIEITNSRTVTQTFDEDGQTITVGNGGDISTTGSAGIFEAENTGVKIVINTQDVAKGVAASGNSSSAINFSGSATRNANAYPSINLLSGRITSNATGSVGTISFTGASDYPSIITASDTAITNTASNDGAAEAIHYHSLSNANSSGFTFHNSGTISTNNNANSIAISLFNITGAGQHAIFNNGLISGATAISVAGGSISIENFGDGIIEGAIKIGADDTIPNPIESSILNKSTITGNIFTNRSLLSITNTITGTITGAVNLGSNGGSSITNDGLINGNITLGDPGQELTNNSGTINGTIDGGLVTLENTTINGNIGQNITPFALTIVGQVDAAINNNSIKSFLTVINQDATLALGTGTLSSSVDGVGVGLGTINLKGNNTISSILGGQNGLAAVNILKGVSITANNSIKAITTTIGAGLLAPAASSLELAENKSITGNVLMNSGSTLTLNDGSSVSGAIDSAAGSAGIISSNGSVSFAAIGQNNSIAEFNVALGTATFNNNVAIDQINIAGALSLTNATEINGSISVLDGGNINLNNANQTVLGSFTANEGSIITLGINSSTSAASLTAVGVATISANTILRVTFAPNATAVGSSYTIISGGTGSEINQIANINVNGSGTNKSGAYSFATAVLGNNLLLNVLANDTPLNDATLTAPFVNNSNELGAYNAIAGVAEATGGLATIQNYLNSNNFSNDQKNAALKSVLPEVDNSINRISFNNTSATANIITERVSFVHNYSTQDKLSSPKALAGVASGDKPKTNSLWIQPFGAKSRQSGTAQGEGYTANSNGLALGADTKISKDMLVGVSFGYAASNIKSQTQLQSTKIDSYQFNLYSGYENKDYFVNTVLGATWNEYESQRNIPVAGVVARSSYSGQIYSARAEIGMQNRLGNNFILTPKLMITAAHNAVADYSESGAGTLNLAVKNDATNFLEGRASIALSRYFFFNKKRLLPEISASYGYDFIGDEQKSSANFVGQTTTFLSQGSKVAQGNLKLGAGVQFFQADTITLTADYAYDHRVGYIGHYGTLRFKYGF